jgi:hypothetical protein
VVVEESLENHLVDRPWNFHIIKKLEIERYTSS